MCWIPVFKIQHLPFVANTGGFVNTSLSSCVFFFKNTLLPITFILTFFTGSLGVCTTSERKEKGSLRTQDSAASFRKV